MTNRFAGYGDNGGVPFEKYTPAVSRIAKPKNPTKPKSRLAHNVGIDDEDGFIPNAKRENNMTDNIDRGPFAKMLDKMALAHQAQFGGSYEQAYTKIYTDPSNASIRDRARFDHLAQQSDAMHGTELSLIPAQKAAPPDPAQDHVSPGPAHAELERLVVRRMRNNPKLSYQQSFTQEHLLPANRSLKDRVDSEGILRAQAREPAPAFPRRRGIGVEFVSPRRKVRASFILSRAGQLQPGSPFAKAMAGCLIRVRRRYLFPKLPR